MKKYISLSLLGIFISLGNVYATYPVVDFRNIAESVNQIRELSKQTGIMDEQTRLMIEELGVLWSTYDNALDMYNTLGNYNKALSRIKGTRVYRDLLGANREYGRIAKRMEGGVQIKDIGPMARSAKRILRNVGNVPGTSRRDYEAFKRKIERNGQVVMRRSYMQSLIRNESIGEDASEEEIRQALDSMTVEERSQSMLENSWISQAEAVMEVEELRNFNQEIRQNMRDSAINDTPEDILTAVELNRLATIQNTEVTMENMDIQTELLVEQNRLLLEGNEMLNTLNPERSNMVNSIMRESF